VLRIRFETKAGEDIEGLAFSPDGNRVATTGRQQLLRVLDTQTGAERVAVWFDREVRWVAFSPDGSLVAVAGTRPPLLVDAATGKLAKELDGFGVGLTDDVGFSPDGSQVAATGGSPTTMAESQKASARIWSVATGKWLRSRYGHRDNTFGKVIALDYSADGTLLATASAGGVVHLWDAQTGDWRRAVATGMRLSAMALRPDGRVIALGTREEGVVLLDLSTELEVGKFDPGLWGPNTLRPGAPDGGGLVPRRDCPDMECRERRPRCRPGQRHLLRNDVCLQPRWPAAGDRRSYRNTTRLGLAGRWWIMAAGVTRGLRT
jgi:WD40 repeat protein